MSNNYQKLILLLKERNSINSKEFQELSQLIKYSQKSSEQKYETELFQNISIYLGKLLDQKFTSKKHFSSGGFAYAGLLTNKNDNKPYVIKYLHYDKKVIEEYKERFIREIINTLSVKHSNIPQLMYFGKSSINEEDQEYYYIMDFINGNDFNNYVFGDKRKDWRNFRSQLVHRYTDILSAMDFLHSNEMYHRDCTLANMMYDIENEKAYLIDLGLSKQFKDTIPVTDPHAFHGNPSYLAPESLMHGKYSVSSDIYTLGASLYSIITQEHPHGLSSNDMDILYGGIRKWMEHKSALHLESLEDKEYTVFDSVIRKSTAFESNDRYQDVKTFLKEYKDALKRL